MNRSNNNRKIILENGSVYCGRGYGDLSEKVVEIVFNTSMVGYQEILSDPSYTDQAVVMTYPLIGNYGIADDDYETETPTIAAMIVKEFCREPSNFRSRKNIEEVMEEFDIALISNIDTRKLTREIRDFGSLKALITSDDISAEEGLQILKQRDLLHDQVSRVSRKQIAESGIEDPLYHVVAIDCGMKENIVRDLNKWRCDVTIVPWNTDSEAIMSLKPDGVFVSNGPGNPADVPEVINTIKNLIGRVPLFGICLGHQIISLAFGARTYKLKFGHRGGNHPVKNLITDKIEITSQNHSYAVDADSLEGTGLKVTHINLLDNTVEGVSSEERKVFAVQYHPESAPGPQDSGYLFGQFTELMKTKREDEAHA